DTLSYNGLVAQWHKTYEVRKQKIHTVIKSADQFSAYQEEIRDKFMALVDVKRLKNVETTITETLNRPGYTIQKFVMWGVGGRPLPANLYIPSGKGPYPAVIFLNGHEMTAKATESYQKLARIFVDNGYVVLSLDPFSQGERIQLTDSLGQNLTRG